MVKPIGNCCFSAKHTVLKSKNNDWLAEILIDSTIAKLSLDIFCDREVHDAHEKFKMMECQPLIW
jgi:hypothetical protein